MPRKKLVSTNSIYVEQAVSLEATNPVEPVEKSVVEVSTVESLDVDLEEPVVELIPESEQAEPLVAVPEELEMEFDDEEERKDVESDFINPQLALKYQDAKDIAILD
jgi:hypothetical protein